MTMSTQQQLNSKGTPEASKQPLVALRWDSQNLLPLIRYLAQEDLVILLTPAVIPLITDSGDASDPFEPLGKALANSHPWIRHVPYTKENGITGTHVAFIKRAKIVIFVITSFPTVDGVSQPQLAEIVREVCEEKPMITVACCDFGDHDIHDHGFSTVVQSTRFSEPELEAIATLLMVEEPHPIGLTTAPSTHPHGSHFESIWSSQILDYERDLAEVHSLWVASVPSNFHLSQSAFGLLLKREGYAMHFIIRDPSGGEVVGFCATFTTYADNTDRLIGSIAAVVVRDGFRGRGIGRMLHDEAFGKLNKVRGVNRIQLGSTFPRLLYGLPTQDSTAKWFENRGWTIDKSGPGKGQMVSDWLLKFADSSFPDFASHGLIFRRYQMSDSGQVLEMAKQESEKRFRFGWYDQYAKLLDGVHENDVIVGFEGDMLAAVAITYIPNSDNPIALDIPWAASISPNVGGVSCICIKGE